MEVHVDRDGFLRGLQMVSNIVEPRQTLPILANVLLEAREEVRVGDGGRAERRDGVYGA